jgi:hypothetical protein
MRLMPIYQKSEASRAAKEHKAYPICWAVCEWNNAVNSGVPTSLTCPCERESFI